MPPADATTILFDMDGVLVDSRAPIARCMAHALRAHGLTPPPDAFLHALIGPPLATAFATILAHLGADAALAPTLIASYRERYQATSVAETPACPGVHALLDALAPGRRLGVVTTKPRAFAAPILAARGLDRHMVIIEGTSLDPAPEAKTVTLGRALAALAPVDKPRTVMVGDRSHDVVAGRAHGLGTVGVLWGIGDREELGEADHLAATPEELAAYFTRR
jgi:phosphoglycolate phosphatase